MLYEYMWKRILLYMLSTDVAWSNTYSNNNLFSNRDVLKQVLCGTMWFSRSTQMWDKEHIKQGTSLEWEANTATCLLLVSCLTYYLVLKMVMIFSSTYLYQITCQYNQQNCTLHSHQCNNLKSPLAFSHTLCSSSIW